MALGAVVFTHVIIKSQIEHQGQRNAHLQTAIAGLDKQVAEIKELQTRRTQLVDRMKVIQDLQGTRPVIVRVFDEVVRTLPDGVYFRSLKRVGGQIDIQGTAESNNRVSSLMRRLEDSDWFSNPNLKAVRANEEFGEQANDFDMTTTITMPTVAVDQKGEGE
jgi:type IV pilus assembly protein PilN